MTADHETVNAEVISVMPDRVRISVDDLTTFKTAETSLRVGSYLKVSDNENVSLICIIESFNIEVREIGGISQRSYIIDAHPLGTLSNGVFKRGGDELAIPPKKVVPATDDEIATIYQTAFPEKDCFYFSSLTRQRDIQVPVDGNKFFNKHIAVVGATGSGKSCSVASILQRATSDKSGTYSGLNNSHIIIFDIHAEYASAFPNANLVDAESLKLPYWLLNDEEMESMYLESGDANNYNQESLLRSIITTCKTISNPTAAKVSFDSPLPYDIEHLENCLTNLTKETKDANDPLHITTASEEEYNFASEVDKIAKFCEKHIDFAVPKRSEINKGPYADGSIDKFVRRIAAKVAHPRLKFIFGEEARKATLQSVLQQLTGYSAGNIANVTIIDLSGVPFDVLSITVSLITRLLFDYGYYSRKAKPNCDTPLLLVYEEAHKYAPKTDLSRYKASLTAIERIAKEGRKYGVSLLIASQRPSEISETIFSQCSNFLAMRLTNPDDQAYVRRLLPDTLGNLTDSLPSLEAGEALLIGDATVMPCVVYVNPCDPEPSSNSIPYFDIWREAWKEVHFDKVEESWRS